MVDKRRKGVRTALSAIRTPSPEIKSTTSGYIFFFFFPTTTRLVPRQTFFVTHLPPR